MQKEGFNRIPADKETVRILPYSRTMYGWKGPRAGYILNKQLWMNKNRKLKATVAFDKNTAKSYSKTDYYKAQQKILKTGTLFNKKKEDFPLQESI